MRKRIVLFANGWGNEFLQEVGYGMRQVAESANADIFAFLNYSSYAGSLADQKCELNIFKLPDLDDFDGAIVLAGSFNTQMEVDYVHEKLLKSRIPAISLEYKLDGIDFLGTDDYAGMYQLANHLVCEHEIHNILFVGGIKEHEGNQLRLKAVMDVLHENDLELAEDNIIYGDFAAEPAVTQLEKWCMRHNYMPEAIICANDVMAIGICDWLKEKGYDIPGDIVVTGYDCLKKALDYEPQITSVNGEWVALGARCMEKLLQKINGEDVSIYEKQDSKLIIGGSCGCNHNVKAAKALELRQKISKDKYVDGFICDQHFRHLYLSVRKAQTQEDLNNSLSDIFTAENFLEGDKITVCLNPDFFNTVDAGDEMRKDGYPEEMEIICSIFGDEVSGYRTMSTRESLFLASNRSGKPGIYIFVPIYSDGLSFGYTMLSKGFSVVQNDIMYIWTRHMDQYMEQVRSNIAIRKLTEKLEMMSVLDGLTHIYNRNGFETVVLPSLLEGHKAGKDTFVMIADVDRLKPINDTYGHSGGDTAIVTATRALRGALPGEYMLCRFGGDEFLITASVDTEIKFDNLVEQINAELNHLVEVEKIPFKMSISLGAVQISSKDSFDMKEALKNADIKMYQMKERHHIE